MTEPEGFLSRWTRLKREACEPREDVSREAAPREANEEATAPIDDAHESRAPAEPAPAIPTIPEVDLSALPPIESITAATDIRGFLAPGVPPELTRAALRRAWVADPNIRDFIGIAENQWDFTAENAVAGFGPLGPLDDVRRLVAQVIGEKQDERDAPPTAEDPQRAANSARSGSVRAANEGAGECPAPGAQAEPPAVEVVPPAVRADQKVDVALQQEVASPAPAKRGHGGALPE